MMLCALLSRISELAASRPQDNIVLGISGIDGAGKSTLAKGMAEKLSTQGLFSCVISVDDYLQPKSVRHANVDQIAGYLEDNFEFGRLFVDIIEPVKSEQNVKKKINVRDLISDMLVEREFDFQGPGILIVEGSLLFLPAHLDWFDMKVWIDISFETAMNRVLGRNRDKRYGDQGAIAARYNERFFPAQKLHLSRDNPAGAADAILPVL